MRGRGARVWWISAAPAASAERRALRASGQRASSQHHLEIVLGHAAVRARPGVRDVFPARARGDALFGQPGRFVVDEATHDAHPGAVGGGRSEEHTSELQSLMRITSAVCCMTNKKHTKVITNI